MKKHGKVPKSPEPEKSPEWFVFCFNLLYVKTTMKNTSASICVFYHGLEK